jgi:RNA polymerase sigma-70 factor (ECF subfamily)
MSMAFSGAARRVIADHASGAPSLAVFDRELDYLTRTLVRMGARRADLDDLLQDVFLVLHNNWPSLDKTSSLRPWLFGVAFRVLRSHRRGRLRESPRDDLDPLDPAPDQESWVQGQQSLSLLMEALERVPLPRRSAIILHYLEGMDVRAVAQKLSISRFGVYTRLFKGRKELAAALHGLSQEETR